jgi:phage baseplate assembly protein gpV
LGGQYVHLQQGGAIKIHASSGGDGGQADQPIQIVSKHAEVIAETVVIVADKIILNGDVEIWGNLKVDGNIGASGSVTDTTGNTNHHSH